MKLPFNYDHTIKRVHAWHTHFVLPKDEAKERKWATNMQISVGAKTVQDAIALILRKYPDAVIYGIQHGGMFLADEEILNP